MIEATACDSYNQGSAMERLARQAFHCRDAGYTFADVLVAAALTGEWAAVEHRLREGTVCDKRARAWGGDPVAEDDLAEAIREFRYAHGLVAAEDAESWLEDWELDLDEWRASLKRRLLRERWADSLERTLRNLSPREERLAVNLWPDLVCWGELVRLTRRLAERAALASDLPATDADPEATLITGAALTTGVEQERLLPSWTGVETRAGDPLARRLAHLEVVYAERRQVAAAPDRVAAAVAAHRLDWTRIEACRLVLPTGPMAAEVALRVREDGEALADVAAELGRPIERWGRFLEELDAELRGHLLSAASGELLGPLAASDGHALLVVESRRSPQPDDPIVHAHAERRLFQSVVDRAMETVRWEGPLGVTRG